MSLLKSFEAEFGPFQSELQRHCKRVKEEVSLASKQAADQERQLQVIERQENSRFRKTSDLSRREQSEWRLQIDQRKASEYTAPQITI
jgi:hypothetical protein